MVRAWCPSLIRLVAVRGSWEVLKRLPRNGRASLWRSMAFGSLGRVKQELSSDKGVHDHHVMPS